MTMPLLVLAILSVIGGLWLNGGVLPHLTGTLASFLGPAVGGGAEHATEGAHSGLSPTVLMLISVGVAALGIIIAWAMHKSGAFEIISANNGA